MPGLVPQWVTSFPFPKDTEVQMNFTLCPWRERNLAQITAE
jgi:hypothetical protein